MNRSPSLDFIVILMGYLLYEASKELDVDFRRVFDEGPSFCCGGRLNTCLQSRCVGPHLYSVNGCIYRVEEDIVKEMI